MEGCACSAAEVGKWVERDLICLSDNEEGGMRLGQGRSGEI